VRIAVPVLTDPAQFAAVAPAGSLLGLDLGTKTIGVAVCDPRRRLASPLETIVRRRFGEDAARLQKLARDWTIVGYVLGLPYNMDGSEGRRAQATRAFARNIAGRQELPILLFDERLSTFAADELLAEAGVARGRRQAIIDQHAAVVILQGAIDRLRRLDEAAGDG
jgi:putative Holliday junction resolvase